LARASTFCRRSLEDEMTDWGDTRSRSIEWKDPKRPARAALGMDGLSYLQALHAGEIPPPPITAVLNMTLESVAKGEVVFGLDPDESLYNPIGSVHGGVICTILDSATGSAVHSTLELGWAYTSIEIKVNYLRGTADDSGHLTAKGWVRKGGRRVAFAESELTDSQGRLIATASSTCLVFEVR
jgi:uncharacterized protein (TIGR00369 family)